jgi:hypothetical protein
MLAGDARTRAAAQQEALAPRSPAWLRASPLQLGSTFARNASRHPTQPGLLRKSNGWSDRPHFATRLLYDQRVWPVFDLPNAPGLPERALGRTPVLSMRPNASTWGLWLYAPLGCSMLRERHHSCGRYNTSRNANFGRRLASGDDATGSSGRGDGKAPRAGGEPAAEVDSGALRASAAVARCLREGSWVPRATPRVLPTVSAYSQQAVASLHGKRCASVGRGANIEAHQWRGAPSGGLPAEMQCAALLEDALNGSFGGAFADPASPVVIHVVGDSVADQLLVCDGG